MLVDHVWTVRFNDEIHRRVPAGVGPSAPRVNRMNSSYLFKLIVALWIVPAVMVFGSCNKRSGDAKTEAESSGDSNMSFTADVYEFSFADMPKKDSWLSIPAARMIILDDLVAIIYSRRSDDKTIFVSIYNIMSGLYYGGSMAPSITEVRSASAGVRESSGLMSLIIALRNSKRWFDRSSSIEILERSVFTLSEEESKAAGFSFAAQFKERAVVANAEVDIGGTGLSKNKILAMAAALEAEYRRALRDTHEGL
jgi:hypothetical protein